MTTTLAGTAPKKPAPEPEHVSSLRRIAHIVGEQSAAARAVAEYDAKVAEGKTVDILRHGDSIFVVW